MREDNIADKYLRSRGKYGRIKCSATRSDTKATSSSDNRKLCRLLYIKEMKNSIQKRSLFEAVSPVYLNL